MKSWYLIGFLWVNKTLGISLVTKIIKKLTFSTFFPEISANERYFDKAKFMYFLIKDEYFLDKYMKIWEKFSNIIKKFSSELIYNKKYLKAEEKFNTKESFQCFYIQVVLIDSVYRIDENCSPRVFLEKLIQKFFSRCITNFGIWGFGSSS